MKPGTQEYRSLHNWVRRQKGVPTECSLCGKTGCVIDYANVSGEYLRDVEDYVALCRPCHREHDRKPTCPKGHPRTPENLKVPKDGRPRCRVCANESWRRNYYRRKKKKKEEAV